MNERTFTCAACGASCTVAVTRGRPKTLCEDCATSRKGARQQAHRGHRSAKRTPNTVCQWCGEPLPAGKRADAKWCSRACQSRVQRRESGQVVQNTGNCSSCLKPLLGQHVHAKVCRSTKCRTWAARHPGVPHPSTQLRTCKQCGESIDHLNGKAKFCSKNCTSTWLREQDREGHNAKARAWQASPEGKAYRQAYQQANAARRQQWARESRQRDPERYSRYWKQWAAANAEAVAELGRMRRARQKGNPDSIGVPAWEWQQIVNRFGGRCAYCGVKPEIIHMDHVVPLSKGGRHAAPNCLPACPKCNLTKHAMFLSVWRYRGRRLGAERLIFQ
jgi:hypothetical protein